MRRALLVWLVCSTAGAIIIALPDAGPRLVSLSETHGFSAFDALGIALVLFGWAVFLLAIWQRRGRLLARATVGGLLAGAFGLGLGTGLVIASVAADYARWWVIGAAVLLVVQLLAATVVTRL